LFDAMRGIEKVFDAKVGHAVSWPRWVTSIEP
jgi:hypothetical protein